MAIQSEIVDWFDAHARDLPWRRPDATPWHVMISEFMLQQTPVRRVLPMYEQWTARWPTPTSLADDSPGEAVRAWGRLGYPRRALRLHQAAVAIRDRHDGEVPRDVTALLALPGVGAYTARAVAAFAFGQREPVVDVNVRRVLARAVAGRADAGPATTTADMRQMADLLPTDDATAARFCAGTMELGALVCVARDPRCADCPLRTHCAWLAAGKPDDGTFVRRVQTYAGTDRQVRGRLLAVLRDAHGPVDKTLLDDAWHLPEQRERALAGLVADGLVRARDDATYALPDA